MKKNILCLCMLIMFTLSAFSQEDELPSDNKPDGTIVFQPVRKGDKFMKIGVSLGIPLFNTSNEAFAITPNIYPGGTINVGFGYYILNGFSLGGSLSFQFYPTLGRNLYFSVPIIFETAYTFAKSKWRFPLCFGLGGAFQSYNGTAAKYFGMIFKHEAGVYYQYSPEWSFGGDVSWSVIPQWYKETSNNRTGNILRISFAARYHL